MALHGIMLMSDDGVCYSELTAYFYAVRLIGEGTFQNFWAHEPLP